MEFVYKPYHNEMTNEQLLADIINVAKQLGKASISSKEYDNNGMYSSSTISRRFGSWNKALSLSGIEPKNIFHSQEDMFRNIEEAWIKKGIQPTRRDMDNKLLSQISSGAYLRMFGRWSNALKAFVEYVNSGVLIVANDSDPKSRCEKESRDVGLRLRFLVMKRDNFKCCACGASPAKDSSVVLHIDHIIPWSLGGKTEMSNLQTLCDKCNLGKSNML